MTDQNSFPRDGTAYPGFRHVYSGKVRDLYVEESAGSLESADRMLVVASDRVSAFDHVLDPEIPGKGVLLTRLSLWWFETLSDVRNHVIAPVGDSARSVIAGDEHADPAVPAEAGGRAMLVRTLDMFPIECVVRGYLAGSGWLEYQESGTVCGIRLPEGLGNGDRLPEPIYTPAYKAPQGEHDENITFDRTVELVGTQTAAALRDMSLDIYRRASAIAEARGVILADTKFEFGADRDTGEATLADEVLTSDSSRYWDAAVYASGNRTDSFDKQIVRNWLLQNWDRTSDAPPPALPPEIVETTAARYRELLERLTA